MTIAINDNVLAVIIGRAGSQGLPGKNAMPLGGRPMVQHTIEDAAESQTVDRVIVSTDCPDVEDAAATMNISVIDRPAEHAGENATVDDAVRHAVEIDGGEESIIVILYANVPLRPDDLIDRAVNELRATKADSVQSYTDVGKWHPYWMVRLDDDSRVTPFFANDIYRRQDLPELLLPDGGVIAVRRTSLFTTSPGQPHAFLGEDRRGIVSPPGSVVDIDTQQDFDRAAMQFQTPAGVA